MIGYYPNVLREGLFIKQQRLRGRRRQTRDVSYQTAGANPQDERRVLESQEQEFSRSLDLSSSKHENSSATNSVASSFVQSVVVAGSEEAGYQIYSTSHDHSYHGNRASEKSYSLVESQSYDHNIGNPGLLQHRKEYVPGTVKEQNQIGTTLPASSNKPRHSHKKTKSKGQTEPECDCGKYHSHRLGPSDFTVSIQSAISQTETRISFPGKDQVVANHVTIANMFWKSHLAFNAYKHRDEKVPFQELWPSGAIIHTVLKEGIADTGLRTALWELCVLSITSGPLSLLKSVLDLKFIRIDHQFGNDPGLLHLACLLRNMEAINLIIQYGISPKLKDKSGRTAGQVCYCNKIRKQLPVWYQSSFLSDRNKTPQVMVPSLQDKDTIFSLAIHPKDFYELQKKLQSFEFPVDKHCNEDEDFLIHIACKTGISHIPLLLSLVKLQNADINLHNGAGMTPLMIVARDGDSILCDLLLCVFGADPNLQDSKNGKTALHYAVTGNHVNVVNCLLGRGIDVNIEDKSACRADDMSNPANTDCREIIQSHRMERCRALTEMVKQDVLYPINLRKTDLVVTDSDGFTLVMLAVTCDRIHNLETLLTVSMATVNAQHVKTGLTALAMAAKFGLHNPCKILLKYGANPAVSDMQDYLPLHHAVLGNHEKCVDVFFQYEPQTYVGLYKALRFCRKSSIHDALTKAWEMRQEKIVIPQLRIASLEGNADKLYCVLEEGDNVDAKSDLNNKSGLFVAAENSHLQVIRLLIERGADLRKRDTETSNTVLHVVCRTGHIQTAQYLLQFCHTNRETGVLRQRIDINAVNNDRKTALQIAAEKGYVKLIALLIKKGATTALLNSQGSLFTCPEYEGARVEIERHRLEHTTQVMGLIQDKSKRSLEKLKQIWVPRFDHNLRDRNGNTPLMVACRYNNIDLVNYLLPSAVYANHIISDDDSDSKSDDSGVPDLPPWKSRAESALGNPDDLEKSGEFAETMALGASCDITRSLNPSDFLNSIPASQSNMGSAHLNTFLTDVERPKGLYVYHDGIVSHVCAVNLYTGNTPLHCAIEGGDNMAVISTLLEADSAVINMQNTAGLTAVHLACKNGRKKSLQVLLGVSGLDLNLRSLNGSLPEDLATNNSVKKMLAKARSGQPLLSQVSVVGSSDSKSVAGFTESLPQSIGKASTIDFDKINIVYQSMKYEGPNTKP